MRIYKYFLSLGRRQTLYMPPGAVILTVQLQDQIPTLWAIVNPDEASSEARTFCIYGTGADLPEKAERYIGTVQLNGFVWHVFEKPLDKSLVTK